MEFEEYVPLIVAKRLKELGFDERSIMYYVEGNAPEGTAWIFPGGRPQYHNRRQFRYAAPTWQAAMAWLYEKKNIFVEYSIKINKNDPHDIYFHINVWEKGSGFSLNRVATVKNKDQYTAIMEGILKAVDYLQGHRQTRKLK